MARMGEKRSACRILVARSDAKRPLERPRRRWEGNIKMDLKEMVSENMDLIDLPLG